MSEWYVPDCLLRLLVLTIGAVGIPTLVRRHVGGRTVSYAAITVGVVVLIAGVLFQLVVAAVPAWSESLGAVSQKLPVYGGGYLLILAGFLSLMRDMGVAQAVARQAAAAERLSAEQAQRDRDSLRGIIETSHLFICGFTLPDERLTLFNHGAELASGYNREEIMGKPCLPVFFSPEDAEEARRGIASQAEKEEITAHLDKPIRTKSGDMRMMSWTCTVSKDARGRAVHAVAFGLDVTEQSQLQANLEQAKAELERANAALEHMAATDYLTGLVNRRQAAILFDHEIARGRRNDKPVSVIVIDIDHFKLINDSYGHEAGDAALKCLSDQFRWRLRASDIAARYGGEEFLLVLPETDLEGAARLGEMLRRVIQDNPVAYYDKRIAMSASFGVASADVGQTLTADALVRMADEAMYCAKGLGGNRVVTWNGVREGTVEPSLAACDEVRDLQRRVEAITQRNDTAVLENLYHLAQAIEAANPYMNRHSCNVAQYAVAIAREMGLGQTAIDTVYRAAMLHDLGKSAIPHAVIWKGEPLSKSDWALVCQHPIVSVKVIERLPFLRREMGIIRHHHERPDGRGYPDGLRGENIPIEARILAVANAIEAMTRIRPYRPAMTLDEAFNQLRTGAPRQFDMATVDAAAAVAAKAGNWPLSIAAETPISAPSAN